MNQDVRNNEIIRHFQNGGPIKDWWDDRYARRRDRKRKKIQNKTKKAAIKQCKSDSKGPMCKRRR
mgnify:CR=1 FL=1